MPPKIVWFAMLVVLVSRSDFAAAASQSASREPFAVIRVVDPELRRLVLMGRERSATFRQLVEEICGSRWLVFIQAGRCPEKAAVACLLHFAGVYHGAPYMRVLVAHQGRHPDSVIATIAHELQHAAEVIRDAGVVDSRTMREMFGRIGTVSVRSAAGITYETADARAVGEQVLRDLGQRDAAAFNAHRR
jgi:hypothetical protein